MNLPTLSIIIPNYNHGHCLPVAMEAILRQSAQPLEVIIIDDGSTDRSVQVIEDLANRHSLIKFYRNPRNLGVCLTVNRGMDLARGEYVFSTAADDVILPGFFEKSLQVLAQYPQAGLSCTIADWREAATGLHWHVAVGMAERPSYLSPERMMELERQRRLFISSNSTVFKRSVLLETGKLVPELQSSADWFACSVIGFRFGICYVPEPLAVLNILPNSYYQRIRRDPQSHRQMLEAILQFLNRPEYRDLALRMREAGSLYHFGIPMLKLLLGRPKYRHLITPVLVRNGIWRSTQLLLKKFTPTPLGNLLFRLAGYRARTPAVTVD